MFILGDLRQITVIGLGLLGGSVARRVLSGFAGVKVIGYAHRASTREKAEELAVATEVAGDLSQSVAGSDIVILATPIQSFAKIFTETADALRKGCIVTDVGSTKALVHQWAAKLLPKTVHYVGSHPIAGSEQRGVEFSRDDLFEQAECILTRTKNTNRGAIQKLKDFWGKLGCRVRVMSPAEHDRILANVSHLPHMVAAGLLNANNNEDLKSAGKGFMDTSRVASGPANIWVDILMTNPKNCTRGIDGLIAQLEAFKKAIGSGDSAKVEKLLQSARKKRAALIKYKLRSKELIP